MPARSRPNRLNPTMTWIGRDAAYATKHEVHHFWSCDHCGHEIEIVVNLRVDTTSEQDKILESVVA